MVPATLRHPINAHRWTNGVPVVFVGLIGVAVIAKALSVGGFFFPALGQRNNVVDLGGWPDCTTRHTSNT